MLRVARVVTSAAAAMVRVISAGVRAANSRAVTASSTVAALIERQVGVARWSVTA